jgi:hypothetical protein
LLYFQEGNQKEIKFENNNEENFDLEYLFKISSIPMANSENIIIDNNTRISGEDNCGSDNMINENDYEMMDDEVQVE